MIKIWKFLPIFLVAVLVHVVLWLFHVAVAFEDLGSFEGVFFELVCNGELSCTIRAERNTQLSKLLDLTIILLTKVVEEGHHFEKSVNLMKLTY